YRAAGNQRFCGVNTVLDAQEGKRHTVTRLTFENTLHKLEYDQRDLVRNSTEKRNLTIPPCTYEIAGALAELRTTKLEPGSSTTLPITDGKKMVYGKIAAQTRENVSIEGRKYQAIRYEAFLFDNVLYKRKGRLFVWITDDSDRIPVQLRFQLAF